MTNFNNKKYKNYKTEFIKYLISGFILNLISFIFYGYLIIKLEFEVIISITMVYLFIIPIYFISQNFFVFKKNNIKKGRLLKFLVNIIIFYLLNIFLIYILIDLLSYDKLISQFLILILLAILNFISQKKLIFNFN